MLVAHKGTSADLILLTLHMRGLTNQDPKKHFGLTGAERKGFQSFLYFLVDALQIIKEHVSLNL